MWKEGNSPQATPESNIFAAENSLLRWFDCFHSVSLPWPRIRQGRGALLPYLFFFSSSAILNLFLAVTVAVASIQRTVLAQKYIISCLNEFWEDMQLKIIH